MPLDPDSFENLSVPSWFMAKLSIKLHSYNLQELLIIDFLGEQSSLSVVLKGESSVSLLHKESILRKQFTIYSAKLRIKWFLKPQHHETNN